MNNDGTFKIKTLQESQTECFKDPEFLKNYYYNDLQTV